MIKERDRDVLTTDLGGEKLAAKTKASPSNSSPRRSAPRSSRCLL
jgi:hypothetical protein